MTHGVQRPLPAYESDESYIFVTYAHEDTDVAYPHIRWLQQQGFKVWWGEGISPDAQWRAEIGQAIRGCSLLLYLVTPKSIRRWTTQTRRSKNRVGSFVDQPQPGAEVMMRLLAFFTIVTVSGGCTTVSTVSRPDAYFESTSSGQTPSSLFSGDATTLSDDAIQEILAYEYEPPVLGRVALMPFAREIWSSWSEELAVASENMKSSVLDRLRASPSIYDASYLPSILVPENRTVPYLREAAARYQADLLLVYRSHCQNFERYRLFAPDKSRAYCGVEAVLLDTRTGLVPFTTVATRSFDMVENREDMNFRETRLRAQLDATATALGDVSAEIVQFLAEKD